MPCKEGLRELGESRASGGPGSSLVVPVRRSSGICHLHSGVVGDNEDGQAREQVRLHCRGSVVSVLGRLLGGD